VKVAAHLESTRLFDPADLHRLEAGRPDQPLDFLASTVVVGHVEEDRRGEEPFAWLLPAVGFVAVVLAASTWVSPLRAAIAVSAVWLAVVWLLAARSGSPDAVLQARVQAGFLAAAAVVTFLARRRWLRQLRPWR